MTRQGLIKLDNLIRAGIAARPNKQTYRNLCKFVNATSGKIWPKDLIWRRCWRILTPEQLWRLMRNTGRKISYNEMMEYRNESITVLLRKAA